MRYGFSIFDPRFFYRRDLRRQPGDPVSPVARRATPAGRAPRRPRLMPASEIERWCEIVAAMTLRTLNRRGRHLSTMRILDLLIPTAGDHDTFAQSCMAMSLILSESAFRKFHAAQQASMMWS